MGTTLASFAKLLVGALGEVVFLAQHSSNPTCNNKAESMYVYIPKVLLFATDMRSRFCSRSASSKHTWAYSQGITKTGSPVSLDLRDFSHTPSMQPVKFEENALKIL